MPKKPSHFINTQSPLLITTEKSFQNIDIFEEVEGAELFHDTDGVPWARVPVNGHLENHSLKSSVFKLLVTKNLREWLGEMPSPKIVKDAILELEGVARFDRPERPVAMRIAEHSGEIYIDLGDADWQAAKVTPEGWSIVSDLPVRFRRNKKMRQLPIPTKDGKVSDLFKVINVENREHQILILAWLVAALRPTGPYPLCVMYGQQGSAKTMTQTFLRRLIDPSSDSSVSSPRDERDLIIEAKHSHILAFDNLSHVSNNLSDALCRMATGAGFATRALYTDDEQMTFSGSRPVIFNGIEHIADRGDLLDRMILLRLPKIKTRVTEASLRGDFAKIEAGVFGALLNAVSCALRNVAKVQFEELPRMADFAEWAVAGAPELGFTQNEFVEAYEANRKELRMIALESSCATEVVEWFNRGLPSSGRGYKVGNVDEIQNGQRVRWVGTYKELMFAVKSRPYSAPASGFPSTPKALQTEMARCEPNLIEAGIRLNHLKREPGTGRRLIELIRIDRFAAPVQEASNREKARQEFLAKHPEHKGKNNKELNRLVQAEVHGHSHD